MKCNTRVAVSELADGSTTVSQIYKQLQFQPVLSPCLYPMNYTMVAHSFVFYFQPGDDYVH